MSDYGPKMQALPTDRHRAFVLALAEQTDEVNLKAAYQKAGYGNGNHLADAANANIMAKRPDILEAYEEVMEAQVKTSMGPALHRINQIIRDGKGDPGAVRAAINALDRGGLTPKQRVEHTHVHAILNDKQMLSRILQLARILELPAERLLGARTVKELEDKRVIDVTPTEIPKEW